MEPIKIKIHKNETEHIKIKKEAQPKDNIKIKSSKTLIVEVTDGGLF